MTTERHDHAAESDMARLHARYAKPDADLDSVWKKLLAAALLRFTFYRAADTDDVLFALQGSRTVHPVQSARFEERLRSEAERRYGVAATGADIDRAQGLLLSAARELSPTRVAIRYGRTVFDGVEVVLADLGADQFAVLSPGLFPEVVPSSRLGPACDEHPVFMRSPGAAHMPLDLVRAEVCSPLPVWVDLIGWHFGGRDARDRTALVLGWATAHMLGHRALLYLDGPQGSGKSTLATTVAQVVDEVNDPWGRLLRKPKSEQDLYPALERSGIAVVDNVSEIGTGVSDLLCQVVTGGRVTKRRLYTDNDEYSATFRAGVILTGIDIRGFRPDLTERLLTVELQRPKGRRTDDDVAALRSDLLPVARAGLYWLTGQVLAVLPSIRMDKPPRMAGFARVLAAVDTVLGTDAFGCYMESVRDGFERAGLGDPVVAALSALVPDIGARLTLAPTPMRDQIAATLIDLDRDEDAARIPRDPRSVNRWIMRQVATLEAVGIRAARDEQRTRNAKPGWTVERVAGHGADSKSTDGDYWLGPLGLHSLGPLDDDPPEDPPPNTGPKPVQRTSAVVATPGPTPIRHVAAGPLSLDDIDFPDPAPRYEGTDNEAS